MARYSTARLIQSISGAATIASPLEGTYVTFTGSAPYTVNLPSPVLYSGYQYTFYNSTSGTITLSTPSGVFNGAVGGGSSTIAVTTNVTISINSDGTNYQVISNTGSAVSATTLTTSSTVTLSPANANVAVSPSGTGTVTIAPASAGTMNNMSVGQSTAAAGTFTTLTATNTTTLQQITEVLAAIGSYGTSQAVAFTSGDVFYLTGMTGNFTFNYTSVPTTSARTITLTLILGQGGAAYVPTTLQINGSGVTINWAGGVTPTGRASKIDVVSFFIYNVSGTFVALASLGSYG